MEDAGLSQRTMNAIRLRYDDVATLSELYDRTYSDDHIPYFFNLIGLSDKMQKEVVTAFEANGFKIPTEWDGCPSWIMQLDVPDYIKRSLWRRETKWPLDRILKSSKGAIMGYGGIVSTPKAAMVLHAALVKAGHKPEWPKVTTGPAVQWNDLEPPAIPLVTPYDGGLYLVVTKTDGRGAAHKRVEIARYITGKGWTVWPTGKAGRKITHWRELPDLPLDQKREP